jgi:hypothetical protein
MLPENPSLDVNCGYWPACRYTRSTVRAVQFLTCNPHRV